jgi:nicotinamidase-related amidase
MPPTRRLQEAKIVSEWSLAGRPALLVVHMQNSICQVGGSLEGMGHCKAARDAGIIPNIKALQEAFRAKKLPVVFVIAQHPDKFHVPAYGPFWPAARDMGVNLKGTEDVQIIDELAPDAGELIFCNWPFGVFRVNKLEKYLRKLDVETVVLTGVATGMAIGHASFSLADRLFSLIVPADTCADTRAGLHKAVLEEMLPPIGLVTTTRDVLAHL